ncbi:MAG: 8-oxo-dGTP pyrophosphatase MutT (NUDIX family) [Pirellulaceae bacterium]
MSVENAGTRPLNLPLFDQAAVIPYRIENGELQICLITTRGKGRWGVPKGNIEPGHNFEQTALEESFEEAGLRGGIAKEPLGIFRYYKSEELRQAVVVLMEVTSTDSNWKEVDSRSRDWVSPRVARVRLENLQLRSLLDLGLRRIHAKHAQQLAGSSKPQAK